MADLTPRETELVALGTAFGSNCVPCVEYHIREARKAGLSDAEIRLAIDLADKVREVPAQKVLNAAISALGGGSCSGKCGTKEGSECADINKATSKGCC